MKTLPTILGAVDEVHYRWFRQRRGTHCRSINHTTFNRVPDTEKMNKSSRQQSISTQRLVQAAATERLSTNKQSKTKGIKGIAKGSWDKIRRLSSDSQLDDRDDGGIGGCGGSDFFGRCSITVTPNSQGKAAAEAAAAAEETTGSKKNVKVPRLKKSRRKKGKKSVSFHRYDEVIYADTKEYVYSLHDVEVEQENANRDLVDDIGAVVGDVGYFFRCLTEGIKEEAAKTLGDRTAAAS